jgi:hypothetical protein
LVQAMVPLIWLGELPEMLPWYLQKVWKVTVVPLSSPPLMIPELVPSNVPAGSVQRPV